MRASFSILIAGLAAITLAPARAAEPAALSLRDCLDIGRERSVALANTRRERRIAEEDIRRIRAQTLPGLDAGGSWFRRSESLRFGALEDAEIEKNQLTASLNAEQLLYAGGSVRAALRAAESYRIQADEEIDRSHAQLRRDITKAFYLVLYREQAVDVSRASVEQLAQVEAEARMKYESGVLSELEWLSARVRLANEKPALIVAENQRDIARSALANLLYLDDDNWMLAGDWEDPGASAAEPFREYPLHELQALGRENRWELKQARVYLDILEADIRVTEGDYLPEVKAFASYFGSDPSEYTPWEEGWDWQWLAGVRATWTLWDGGARGATRTEKALKKEIAADTITDLERAVLLEIETAFRNRQQALRALEGSRETIQLAEKALDIARLRFERGLGTNIEFTDRNLELNKARIQHLGGMLVYHEALADLAYACAVAGLFEPRSEP